VGWNIYPDVGRTRAIYAGAISLPSKECEMSFDKKEDGSDNMTNTTVTPQSASPTRTSSLGDVATASAASRTRLEQPVGSGLEARNVHAWFGKYHAISDMSLDFPTGTVTALIGPSGCGKSTFLRTLNRMHEFIPGAAMAGEVLLHGRDIYAPGTDVTKIRLKIGMVFQKPNPFP